MMRRLVALSFAVLFGFPVQAQAPDAETVRAEAARMLDAQGTALNVDVYITSALQEARAAGPLAADWVPVLNTNAVLIMEGLCRHERGFALLDEAERIAARAGNTFLRDTARVWRAYYEARFGLRDSAKALLGGLEHPLENLMEEAERDALEGFLAQTGPAAGSVGFSHCVDLMQEAARLMRTSDYEQARSMISGIYLPEDLLVSTDIRLVNAAFGMMTATVMQVARDPLYRGVVRDYIGSLAVPGSAPPELRPGIARDGDRDLLIEVLSFAADPREDTDAARTARRWLEAVSAAQTGQTATQLSAEIDAAILRADWASAAQMSRALAERPDTGPAYARLHEVQALVFDSFMAVAQGAAIDHDALAGGFAEIAADPDLPLPNKIDATSLITQAFDNAGQIWLAWLAGDESWQILRFAIEESGQSADGIIGMAQGFRLTADIAIRNGFDVAAQPPEGQAPPPGLCQELSGIEVCTILVQQP